MKRSIKNLKGGRKELMDFFEEFKFENMRNKSKKGRKKTASFIDKTANSITKTSKKIAKTLRINKLLKTSKNIGKRVLKKSYWSSMKRWLKQNIRRLLMSIKNKLGFLKNKIMS